MTQHGGKDRGEVEAPSSLGAATCTGGACGGPHGLRPTRTRRRRRCRRSGRHQRVLRLLQPRGAASTRRGGICGQYAEYDARAIGRALEIAALHLTMTRMVEPLQQRAASTSAAARSTTRSLSTRNWRRRQGLDGIDNYQSTRANLHAVMRAMDDEAGRRGRAYRGPGRRRRLSRRTWWRPRRSAWRGTAAHPAADTRRRRPKPARERESRGEGLLERARTRCARRRRRWRGAAGNCSSAARTARGKARRRTRYREEAEALEQRVVGHTRGGRAGGDRLGVPAERSWCATSAASKRRAAGGARLDAAAVVGPRRVAMRIARRSCATNAAPTDIRSADARTAGPPTAATAAAVALPTARPCTSGAKSPAGGGLARHGSQAAVGGGPRVAVQGSRHRRCRVGDAARVWRRLATRRGLALVRTGLRAPDIAARSFCTTSGRPPRSRMTALLVEARQLHPSARGGRGPSSTSTLSTGRRGRGGFAVVLRLLRSKTYASLWGARSRRGRLPDAERPTIASGVSASPRRRVHHASVELFARPPPAAAGESAAAANAAILRLRSAASQRRSRSSRHRRCRALRFNGRASPTRVRSAAGLTDQGHQEQPARRCQRRREDRLRRALRTSPPGRRRGTRARGASRSSTFRRIEVHRPT